MPTFEVKSNMTMFFSGGMKLEPGRTFIINSPNNCVHPFATFEGKQQFLKQMGPTGFDFPNHPEYLNTNYFKCKKI